MGKYGKNMRDCCDSPSQQGQPHVPGCQNCVVSAPPMTIDKDGLASLLERVREAKGPDREVDAQMFVGLRLNPEYSNVSTIPGYVQNHPSSHMTVPAYTASIDASLALVERLLPGSMKRVCDNPDDGSARAEIVSGLIYSRGDHDTWPLAILSVLLAALKEAR